MQKQDLGLAQYRVHDRSMSRCIVSLEPYIHGVNGDDAGNDATANIYQAGTLSSELNSDYTLCTSV
jgi:hypothetical protein